MSPGLDARRAVGARIKRARRARMPMMGQQQLADALKVSRAAVSKWERGEALPQGDEVFEFLGIDPPDRFGFATDDTEDDPVGCGLDGVSAASAHSAGDPRSLDALPDTVLLARAQELQAEASRLLSVLAGRYGSQSVPAPTNGQHPRLRRIPLEDVDRPGDQTSG